MLSSGYLFVYGVKGSFRGRLVYMLSPTYRFVYGEGGSLTEKFVCFLPGEDIVLFCVGMCMVRCKNRPVLTYI